MKAPANTVIIVVIFVAIFVRSVPHKGPRKVITNCSDSNRVSYCSSCFNVTNCEDGFDTVTKPCNAEIQACIQADLDSFCGPRENVPRCDCARGEGELTADVYDPQKGYECVEDGPVIPISCGRDEVFDEGQGCVKMFSSTPLPPQPTFDCDEDEISFTQLDCTSYQHCFYGYKQVFDCENGDIFSPVTNQCELYVPFTCTGRPDGLYPDSVRCDMAWYCQREKMTSQVFCANGTVWDTVQGGCSSNAAASTLTGCFIPVPDYVTCTSGNETYAINTHSYFNCTANASGGFGPIPLECDSGSYFDATHGTCLPYSLQQILEA